MDESQKEYFEKRAVDEREAAEHASDERAVRSHRELAKRYDEIAKGKSEPEPADEGASVLASEFRILP